VDNRVVTTSNITILKQLKSNLKEILKIKWAHQLDSIVGLSIEQTDQGFVLSQPKLVDSILNAEWDGGLTAKTPLPPNFNAVTKDKDPGTSTRYLLIIGRLSYLAVGSRPNITFAVNYLA
jgi:hypothetical protein